MPLKLIRQLIGSRNERVLREMRKVVQHINALEPTLEKLSDAALQAQTALFRARFQQGESLDQLLVEAFATVRETSRRVLGLRHFDVQLIGGMVLHRGKIAEMRMGEGKTLVATLPTYLNALSGKGVHVITVNDYLAERDAKWMEPIYQFLGLTVGVNLSNMPAAEKKIAYAADVTYGTNNEFGFDYLRDNMAFSLDDRVQRDLHFAIVDEVDSILIDEARTPLIISGAAEDSSALYLQINKLIPHLVKQQDVADPQDFTVDEKSRQIALTEKGHEKIESLLVSAGLLGAEESLYAPANIRFMHHVYAALRAHEFFKRDVDYVIQNNQVVIVDEHTGRTMSGRRWSEGLHQAVEAKEGLAIQNENQTLASITFQNYFRLYQKLSGMTGTADTEAYEFQQIYGLEVIVIPTNKKVQRKDLPDKIYMTAREKFSAILEEIKIYRTKQVPVLVGTASIETSELLSAMLTQENIPHQVLNAKYHAKEAEIIAEAGRPGSVTIATNMAGRGTDIVLGGNPELEIQALGAEASEAMIRAVRDARKAREEAVVAAGGLHIIGTERNESRRIDNQLRGRAGRQGDPGQTQFYLALDDNLMRIFAGDWLKVAMQRLGMKEGESIEHNMVSRAIEKAQRKVEGRNFDMRKQLLEFDDVANDQRRVIYAKRTELMQAKDVSAHICSFRYDAIANLVNEYMPPHSLEEQWRIPELEAALFDAFGEKMPIQIWLDEKQTLDAEALQKQILVHLESIYAEKTQQVGVDVMRHFEQSILLQVLDNHWREHLAAMDYLRQGIHWRGYAQKNPKQEYKREAFQLFATMLESIKTEVLRVLSHFEVHDEQEVAQLEAQRKQSAEAQSVHFDHQELGAFAQPDFQANPLGETETAALPKTSILPNGYKVGRNDVCPCGSGKKFKYCHGILSSQA
jgi:preprotein translocase subunit SecA